MATVTEAGVEAGGGGRGGQQDARSCREEVLALPSASCIESRGDDTVFSFEHKVVVVCFGDSLARRQAEKERPSVLALGRLRVGTQALADKTCRRVLGANPEEDGRWLHGAVVAGASMRNRAG